MTFLLTFDRTHRVLKAKATGVVATQDLEELDGALIAFLVLEETADRPLIRGLYDFREALAIAVPQSKATERGGRPPIIRGQRVMVLSSASPCSLIEIFERSQRLAGHSRLAVVSSLTKAYELLGLNSPHFEDIR
jgi:hypothetical protein